MPATFRSLMYATALLAPALVVADAFAQTDHGAEVGEIVVTALKRESSLL